MLKYTYGYSMNLRLLQFLGNAPMAMLCSDCELLLLHSFLNSSKIRHFKLRAIVPRLIVS